MVDATISQYYFYEALDNNLLIDSALIYSKKAYYLDKTNISILRQYTHFLKYFSGGSDTTLAYFSRLADLDPQDTTANLYIGSCLLDSGYYVKALPYIIKAQQSNPKSANCNYALANNYLQTHDNFMANKFIKKAVFLNPKDSLYYIFLLDNISKCEPYDSLYKYLEVGSKLNLSSIISYKRYVDSVNLAISSFRDNLGELDSLLKLAELNYYARNYKQAAFCLDGALAKGFAEGDIYVQRVSLFIEMGEISQALNFINAKLKLAKNNYLLFFSAIINTQLNNLDVAKGIFDKLKKDNSLPELNNAVDNYLTFIARNSKTN